MDQRTYELIAQFITDRTGVRVVMSDEEVPYADPDTKSIHLPFNIKDENVYAALAIVMHEAGHIQHSRFDHEKLTGKDMDKFGILNAIEDIRIDLKNFNLLPNIKEFYRQLMRKHIGNKNDADWARAPIQNRILATIIVHMEEFKSEMRPDQDINKFIADNKLCDLAYDLMNRLDWYENSLNQRDLDEAKNILNKIYNILYKNKQLQQQQQEQQGQGVPQKRGGGTGNGKGSGQKSENADNKDNCSGDQSGDEDENSEGDGSGENEPDDEGETGDKDERDAGASDPGEDEGDADSQGSPGGKGCGGGKRGAKGNQIKNDGASQLLRRRISDVFKQSHNPSAGRGKGLIGEAALEETTKSALRELLNEKCLKIVEDGNILDTGSLTSYFTGEIETLFKEVKNEKRKKSKIVLMLDASGSMSDALPFNNGRKYTRKTQVVISNAKAIKRVLEEIIQAEGMNVVYEAWAFSGDAWRIDSQPGSSFEEAYHNFPGSGGGTDIVTAFDTAHKSLMEPDVEGEKLLIFATDGEVGEDQVASIKKRIMWNNSNTKALIVGIGANINGFFVKEVIGNANILAEEHSDIVLMEAIMRLLGA